MLEKLINYLFSLSLNIIPKFVIRIILVCITILYLDNISSYITPSKQPLLSHIFDPCSILLSIIHFMLGIVNIVGFTSFYIQIELILSNGLQPAYITIEEWKKRIHQRLQRSTTQDTNKTENPSSDTNAMLNLQRILSKWLTKMQYRWSIFWISGSSDFAIRTVCFSGIITGFLICFLTLFSFYYTSNFTLIFQLLSILKPLCFIFNAWLYLSLIEVSGNFLGLQSDANLVEINFLMFICSPLNVHYSYITICVLRWLSFRTMLGCGICKWFGSEMWRNLSAMFHHYYNQPLPNPISYYIQTFSYPWMHRLSVVSTLVIESPLCFLCFCSFFWLKYLAFIGFQGMNLLINTTGNYGFIGALNMTENMSLLSDFIFTVDPYSYSYDSHWYLFEFISIPISISFVICYVFCSLLPLLSTSRRYEMNFLGTFGIQLNGMYAEFRKRRFINRYAKFGSMSVGRYEFVIEGSNDCKKWVKYEFLFKPSNEYEMPAVVPLHIPRLDWNTWFLPLRWKRHSYGEYRPPEWWIILLQKLSVNQKSILKLLKYNPFASEESGPKYLRTSVFKFEFVDVGVHERVLERKENVEEKRVWWKITPQKLILMLDFSSNK